MKQYAVLDSDLSRLTTSNRLVAAFGALASGSLAFSASCWLQMQQDNISAYYAGEIWMGGVMSLAVGAVFLVCCAWGWWSESTLTEEIKRTSTEITTAS